MEVLWLGDPACHDPSVVGGKAAQLSRLAEAYRVPPGFCLTADFNAHQLQHAAMYHEIDSPYQLLAALCGEAAPSVAVRSSAVDEDGAFSSFAGLHETYLNVSGVEAVAQAAVACWQSAQSDRAIAYRRERGLSADAVRVAVLVQELVPAECAAVAFSINPVSSNRDEIIIEANWGLGESIVGGIASPDNYTVRKHDLQMVQHHLGDKVQMTVPGPGGTQVVETPRELRARPSLNAAQVEEIGRLVRGLEQRMGWPVDVECAYRGGVLYLLQCRPVTGGG